MGSRKLKLSTLNRRPTRDGLNGFECREDPCRCTCTCRLPQGSKILTTQAESVTSFATRAHPLVDLAECPCACYLAHWSCDSFRTVHFAGVDCRVCTQARHFARCWRCFRYGIRSPSSSDCHDTHGARSYCGSDTRASLSSPAGSFAAATVDWRSWSVEAMIRTRKCGNADKTSGNSLVGLKIKC